MTRRAALEDGLPAAPHALRREMRRVLRRLAEPGAYARALAGGGFGVFGARNGFARALVTMSASLAQKLIGDGLVSAPPRLVIADAGRAFLRRCEADGDAFQAQHRAMATRAVPDETGALQLHRVNAAESPLAWLAGRRGADGAPLIAPEEYEAGERLREDYARGQLMARVTVDWATPFHDGGGAGERLTLGEAALAARQRVNAALKAVGPGLAEILIDVCCHLRGLEQVEDSCRWPKRTGKVVLRIALARLAAHYGLNTPRRRAASIEAWSSDSVA